MVTPTDYGTCGDIRAVAEFCHERDLPLIVDEAWGAPLPFHDGLPPWGMFAGADVCVTSVHKMGAAVEQSSVFHLQGDRVDPDVLKAREDLLGTTSPSSLVYAALDGWRRQMAEQGKELLDGALTLVKSVRGRLSERGFTVLHDEFHGPELADSVDPLKVVPTSTRWASAGTRPPTGCASTSASPSACPTTAGSWPSSTIRTTTKRRAHWLTRSTPC